jgi:hypothetical protein
MASPSYARAVSVAAMQATFNSAWIAARELSPTKRRLARLGVVAFGSALYAAVTPDTRRAMREARSDVAALRDKVQALEGAEEPEADEPEAKPEFSYDKRQTVAIAGALALTIAVTLSRRRLEKRWLASLARDGHPHPTRALALRMAPVAFVAEMAVQLVDMHAIPRPEDSSSKPG